MPSGVFPVPKFRPPAVRGDRMRVSVRLRTRLRRKRLDAQLAQGGDPSASAELQAAAEAARLALDDGTAGAREDLPTAA